MHVLLRSVPPTLQQATTDAHLRWKLPATRRQVSCEVTVPGSWCTRFCFARQESVSSVLCKFWLLYGGLMATSCKRTYAIPAPRASVLAADHRQPVRPQETLKHSSVSVSVGSLGPGAHKVCLSPLSISGRSRFNSKHEFAPPTVLLGLRLCPCAWGISSQPLQCLPSYWGFSDLERGVYPHGQSREVQPPLLTLDVGYLLSVARCSRTMQN